MNVVRGRFYGAVVEADGRVVMATVAGGRSGARLCSVVRWRPALWSAERLCGKGVFLGVPSHWAEGERRPEETTCTGVPPGEGPSCRAYSTDVLGSAAVLRRNLLGVVTADAALVTVPLFMGEAPDDFLSALRLDGCWAIGVVRARALRCVVRLAPGEAASLGSHIARVRRYAAVRFCAEAGCWPLYVLGGDAQASDSLDGDHRLVTVRGPKRRPTTVDELRAVGVALAALEPKVPRFAGSSKESAGRVVRPWLYGTAAAVVFGAIGAIGWIVGRSVSSASALAARKVGYEQLLGASGESRRLARENHELARRITAIRAAHSHRTRWAEFLQMLASARVEGLSLHLLGSEPLRDDPGAVRIALSGTAARDTDVTAFIGALQKVPYLSDITGTIDHGRGAAPEFRVLCVLRLSAM